MTCGVKQGCPLSAALHVTAAAAVVWWLWVRDPRCRHRLNKQPKPHWVTCREKHMWRNTGHDEQGLHRECSAEIHQVTQTDCQTMSTSNHTPYIHTQGNEEMSHRRKTQLNLIRLNWVEAKQKAWTWNTRHHTENQNPNSCPEYKIRINI